MKKAIEVYDNTGKKVAYLSPEADGIKDCWINIQLNGECTLSFTIPATNEKVQYFTANAKLVVDRREFVIIGDKAIEEVREGKALWKRVTAHESWVMLGKRFPTVSNDPQNPNPPLFTVSIISGGQPYPGYSAGSAGSALAYLLKDTEWQLDVVDVEGVYDLETEKESLLANINKVQELWGGYLVWDSLNKKLSLRDENKWQNYTGFQIRYGKNLKNITRTVDYDIVTRLYPFGEDDLDIGSVNNGVKYIENFQYTNEILEGIWQNQEIADAQALKDKATEVLDKLSRPRYNYRISMVDLRILPDYAHETFNIGDLVYVIDEELGINIRARIIRYRYNVFQPWQCEIEVGDPIEDLRAVLDKMDRASNFVKNVLKPNPSVSNLWKGFVNTFTTQINSANGKLVWNDATLEAIEIDTNGNETGRRVRITPGGIGVSTNGGQTYDTAITGLGVLANKVIVNELYALATSDGLTKLAADGLHVFDRNLIERLIAGRWLEGTQEHFGLKVMAQDGQTVLLDDRGLLQTWQEGRADNVDASNPLVLNVYIPPETRLIKRALLRFRLQAFRAYEKSAASGGGSTVTSQNGGSAIVTSSSGGGSYITSGDDIWYSSPGHTSGFSVTSIDGDHVHDGMTSWTIPKVQPDHQHDYRNMYYAGNHTHAIYSVAHSHSVSIPSHSHGVSIPSHTHNVNIPSHTHPLEFGIYLGSMPSNVGIKINGTDRTTALGGPFNTDQYSLNIAPYLSVGQWNTIEITSSSMGRIDVTVFIQALLSV